MTARTASRPHIVIDPAQRFGQPNVGGVSVDAVVGMVWAEGADAAADEYGLRREDVLVACWYAGQYGLPGRNFTATRTWRERLGGWAESVTHTLWRCQYDAVPDPPSQPDLKK